MPDAPGKITKSLLPVSNRASAGAPVIYFDAVATFGFANGIANLALEIIRFMPSENSTTADRVVVAHLKMSAAAYASLKSSIAALDSQMAQSTTTSVN